MRLLTFRKVVFTGQVYVCVRMREEKTANYRVPARVPPPTNRVGMTSSSQTPSLVEEEAPLLNTYVSRREQKTWSWIPTGLETKNYCAGEGQQQFNGRTGLHSCNQIILFIAASFNVSVHLDLFSLSPCKNNPKIIVRDLALLL
jgi:hypothetical protein